MSANLVIEMVAAQSENGVIGNNLEIPWRVAGEQKLFKEITMGGTLVMGRKTFESIGRPLPGRNTIIVSRSGFSAAGCATATSLEEAIKQSGAYQAPVYIVGGGEIYRQALPLADGIHLTTIHTVAEGNVTFPEFNEGEFELTGEKRYKSNIDYTYRHYQRRKPTGEST